MKEEMGFKLSERFLLLAESRLPKPVCRHRFGGGWPRASDRHMLHAIFFVLRAGCQWKALDATTYGSGSTAHRRFQQWNGTGVFLRLWRVCARQYDEINGIDWRWLAIDGGMTKAPLSKSEPVGRNPTDRGKKGFTRSLSVDAAGIPLSIIAAPANRNDHLLLSQTLKGIVLKRPKPTTLCCQRLCLDQGYDNDVSRRLAAVHGFITHIRPIDKGPVAANTKAQRKARRWVVERAHAWLNCFRRLKIRWERKLANYNGMLYLACALICCRAITPASTFSG